MKRAILMAVLALACSPLHAQSTATSTAPAEAVQEGWMVGPALYVSDPVKSLRFYAEGLGMKLRMKFGPTDKPDMLVGFGKDPMQPAIMLLTDKEGPTPRAIGHVHGFDRIAWRLPGLIQVRARLLAAGYTPGEIKVEHGAIQVMMVTDPDGYRLELIDTMPAPRAR